MQYLLSPYKKRFYYQQRLQHALWVKPSIQWAHLTADFLTGVLEKAQMEVITVIRTPFYLGGPVSQCEDQGCETETTE